MVFIIKVSVKTPGLTYHLPNQLAVYLDALGERDNALRKSPVLLLVDRALSRERSTAGHILRSRLAAGG